MYAKPFMHYRMWRAVLAAALLVMAARRAPAADDVAQLRVFLTDGSSLVSYGEPARVGERVVFSMPTAPGPNPPLHLVDLPAARVDWDRTTRYAVTARAAQYVATRAEADYTELSNDVASTLNDVARTPDPAKRLAIVERARQMLADWPHNHFNYRQSEVRDMLAMLDEAIADLRAANGASRFDITLSAYTDPVALPEPLLPAPTPKEAIDEMLGAANVVETAADRTSLLATAVAAIDRDKAALPAAWAAATRTSAQAAIQTELRIDRSYSTLTKSMVALADRRARFADVRGIERVLRAISARDLELGERRPEAVTALVSAVESRLDAARRLQLARDHYAMRAPALTAYRESMTEPLDLFARLRLPLENIKSLAGSGPATLATMQRTVDQIAQLVAEIAPPEEMTAAHALLVSAVQLAGTAARIRREATLAGDMTRAWDASSAAAGALMLGARARADMQALLRVPTLATLK